MKLSTEGLTIVLSTTPLDMRKSINGMIMAVIDVLEADPQSKQLFVFHNKSQDKLKMLFWDRNGFCMYYKRLEKSRFKIPKDKMLTPYAMDNLQLRMLLAGFDFLRVHEYPDLLFHDFC